MTLNRELLKATIENMRANEEAVNMANWFHGGDRHSSTMSQLVAEPDCGATACAAGWTVITAYKMGLTCHGEIALPMEEANKLLGVSLTPIFLAIHLTAGEAIQRLENVLEARDADLCEVIAEGQYDSNGYDNHGYDSCGYDNHGYGRDGFDEDGYDSYGYDNHGYGRDGFDDHGYGRDGFDEDGYDSYGYDNHGYGRDGFDEDGQRAD